METKHTSVSVELDESQLAAAIEVANRLKAMPPEKRSDPAVVKEMAELARSIRDEVRRRRLALGMSARGEVRSWTAMEKNGKPVGSLGIDASGLVPPTLEELARRRYLLACNRVMAGKVDDPTYTTEELADIADVMGYGSLNLCPVDEFLKSRMGK